MKPLNDYLLIKPVSIESTESGIVIADDGKRVPDRGEVVAKGPMVKGDINVGQSVIFRKYSPESLEVDGAELFLVQEANILGVLE